MSSRDAVLAAYRTGATTRREIAAASGLDLDLVELIVDLLLRDGTLEAANFRPSCVTNGCGTCASARTCSPHTGGSTPVTISGR